MPDGERYYWSELLRLSGEYYRLWQSIRLGRKIITHGRISEFRSNFGSNETRKEALYAEIRDAGLWDRLLDVIEDVEKERTKASEEIEKLEAWEIIGDDTVTGFTIYFAPSTKKYYLVDGREIVRKTFIKLGVIVTRSCETGTQKAHERLAVECTSWTFVKEKSSSDLVRIEGELDDFIGEALEYYFGEVIEDVSIKAGAEYASEAERASLGAGWSVALEEVDYPEMIVYLEYFRGAERKKASTSPIIKTYSDFTGEKTRFPKGEQMDKGGRPKKVTEFV